MTPIATFPAHQSPPALVRFEETPPEHKKILEVFKKTLIGRGFEAAQEVLKTPPYTELRPNEKLSILQKIQSIVQKVQTPFPLMSCAPLEINFTELFLTALEIGDFKTLNQLIKKPNAETILISAFKKGESHLQRKLLPFLGDQLFYYLAKNSDYTTFHEYLKICRNPFIHIEGFKHVLTNYPSKAEEVFKFLQETHTHLQLKGELFVSAVINFSTETAILLLKEYLKTNSESYFFSKKCVNTLFQFFAVNQNPALSIIFERVALKLTQTNNSPSAFAWMQATLKALRGRYQNRFNLEILLKNFKGVKLPNRLLEWKRVMIKRFEKGLPQYLELLQFFIPYCNPENDGLISESLLHNDQYKFIIPDLDNTWFYALETAYLKKHTNELNKLIAAPVFRGISTSIITKAYHMLVEYKAYENAKYLFEERLMNKITIKELGTMFVSLISKPEPFPGKLALIRLIQQEKNFQESMERNLTPET